MAACSMAAGFHCKSKAASTLSTSLTARRYKSAARTARLHGGGPITKRSAKNKVTQRRRLQSTQSTSGLRQRLLKRVEQQGNEHEQARTVRNDSNIDSRRDYRRTCGDGAVKDWRKELQQQLDINNAQRSLSIRRIGDEVSEKQSSQEWVGRPREIKR